MIALIKRIRASDQKTKIKWLIFFSASSMLVVILIWIVALRVITANIEHPAPTAVAGSSLSFGERLTNILKELGFRTSVAVDTIKNSIGSNDIIIAPEATSTNQTN